MSRPNEFTLARRTLLGAAVALGVSAIAFPALSLATGFAPYTKSTFDAALKGSKPVLVHVHAEWCPVCKKQESVFNELSGTGSLKNVSAFVVDFDKETEFKKANNIGSQSIILVFKDGKEVARSGGVTDKDRIATFIGAALQ
ncbi:MAG: thioredoxin [Beijerinckiaceae bacterium]|nr:MAG: thioredoxin [Beijerinckiaceae bacterium]